MKREAPERIRLVKRDGIFDSHWYFPDAAITPFDAELGYVSADLLATVRREEREAAFKDAAMIASDFRRLDCDSLWAKYKTLTLETAILEASASEKGEMNGKR